LHVVDLDGSSAAGKGGRWDATVTITVHDANDAAYGEATVSGVWDGSTSGSCTTGGNGQCAITLKNIRNAAAVTFRVNDLGAIGATYDSGANTDPDGDSDGTEITIFQP
ncbi:MAG: peptidase S8, partial [Candidatus Promineifilaceae bacterium]